MRDLLQKQLSSAQDSVTTLFTCVGLYLMTVYDRPKFTYNYCSFSFSLADSGYMVFLVSALDLIDYI